ncbi:MAG: hypothetical protein ABGZ36_25300, partial [Actinomycetota bacterium]
RYEEAADYRDRMDAIVSWVTRTRRDQALRAAGTLAVSRPARTSSRREVLVARAGWLVGTVVVAPEDVDRAVAELASRPSPSEVPPPEEVAIIGSWVHGPDARLEHSDAPYGWPVASGATLEAEAVALAARRRRAGRPEAALADKRRTRTSTGAAAPTG